MKKIFTLSFTLLCWSVIAQIQQNINKSTGTVSNPINQIDSVRFNTSTNQMEVVMQSGVVAHALGDVVNVTFASTSAACGTITSVTDIDGNVYPVVEIGNQCWTKENLKTSKFADGSVIPNTTNNDTWANLTSPAWCNYENNAGNDAIYGKLYNWYTVADPRNVCPTGWHVPTDADWTVLTDYLGGETVAGGKMKTTSGWQSPNTSATNESGFSGLPGGYRFYYDGSFSFVGYYGFWWSSSESSTASAWSRDLVYAYGNADRTYFNKQNGLAVRCLRD
jgi:uncharacterized protein (TIGR02145 family)